VRISVLGGTGFIGGHLVRRLLADKHQLTLLTNKRALDLSLSDQFATVPGRFENYDALKAVVSGAEVVYHLVGLIAETKSKTFKRTVAEGTAKLVDVCRECGVRKIIYLSAIGTEEHAATRYHQTKYLAEQAIINSGIDYTILRPSLIFGEGDGFVSMLNRMIKSSWFTPVIGDGRYLFQPVYIDDLIEALAQSATNDAAKKQTIEIVGAEKLEYVQILNILKARLNKKRVNLHLPFLFMKFVAGTMEPFLKPAPLTRDQLTMMRQGNVGDPTAMKRIFNIEPRSFESGLDEYLR